MFLNFSLQKYYFFVKLKKKMYICKFFVKE